LEENAQGDGRYGTSNFCAKLDCGPGVPSMERRGHSRCGFQRGTAGLVDAVMRPPCGLMAFSNSERPSRSLKGIYLLRSPAEPSGSAKSRQVAMPAIGLLYGATPHASARAATCINGRVNALGVWSAPPAHHNAADLSVQERRCSDQRSIFVSGSCRSGCLAHRRS
jgi:hypothetical protein